MPTKYGRSLSHEDLRGAQDSEKEFLLEYDSDMEEEIVHVHSSSASGEVHVDGKISSVKIQIKEVTDTMRDNVQKVMERGERMEDLQAASDRLNMVGNEFRDAAKRAQRRAWMQNIKSRIIVIAITLTIILCIIVPIIIKYS
ncbi:synaptobrevin homolog 2-like isoform X2 [Leptopilina heterotoma]|uniref:synaptobrevin homolog 2-like isoform X2 n=1 Tax=Leptopilina heterotoma TaxID=63436 RepID=UPI001CA86B07|nr:synaptobrevin homolog 2-like isoform X2 [Leptopilina heterotoma]